MAVSEVEIGLQPSDNRARLGAWAQSIFVAEAALYGKTTEVCGRLARLRFDVGQIALKGDFLLRLPDIQLTEACFATT